MDAPPLPSWTYAARSAYFGDRVCSFCEHHNPAGSCFCNDCGSPLHLRPCTQCDAVSDRTATTCYNCGAPFATIGAVLPAPRPADASETSGDVDVPASAKQPPRPARSRWRLFGQDRFLCVAFVTILIAGGYAAYRIAAAKPDALAIIGQPIGEGEVSAVPVVVKAESLELEAAAALQASIPITYPETAKRTSAHQHPVTRLQSRQGSAPRLEKSRATAPVDAPNAQTRDAAKQDPWQQTMYASLTRCGGDLINRIICDQTVRRRFCQGHWGEAPECGNGGVVNDRGQ